MPDEPAAPPPGAADSTASGGQPPARDPAAPAPETAPPDSRGGLPQRRPSASGEPLYRSVADGELRDSWTLSEYFASLNTVMRLPSRRRAKPEEPRSALAAAVAAVAAEARPSRGSAPQAAVVRTRSFRPVLLVTAALAAVFLVARMIGGGTDGGATVSLTPALGVWEAEGGSYAGRTFELGAESITFRTGPNASDVTRHRVTASRGRMAADSTLYTILYEEQGRESEFSFWYWSGPPPLIRLRNKPGVAWHRAPPGAARAP